MLDHPPRSAIDLGLRTHPGHVTRIVESPGLSLSQDELDIPAWAVPVSSADPATETAIALMQRILIMTDDSAPRAMIAQPISGLRNATEL